MASIEDKSASTKKEEPNNVRKVNLGDLGAVKFALDETIAEVVEHEYETKENTTLVKIQILLGTFTCMFAVGVYFYPINTSTATTFIPSTIISHYIVYASAVLYFILVFLIQYMSWYVQRDTIILGTSSKLPKRDQMCIRVETTIKDSKREAKKNKIVADLLTANNNNNNAKAGVPPVYHLKVSLVKREPSWHGVYKMYSSNSILASTERFVLVTDYFDTEGTLHYAKAYALIQDAMQEISKKSKST